MSADNAIYGVVVGVVTNNQDPDGMGRVKLRFDWLADDHESGWARVCNPRGIHFLPEVEDTVLVAFENGDPDQPYVLGALALGTTRPPGDGKHDLRIIKSKSGHIVTIDDTKDAEKITIADKTGKNLIEIDSQAGTMKLKVDKDLLLDAGGNITIKAGGDLKLECKGLTAKAQQDVALEGMQNASLKGMQNTTVEATAGLAIKCMAGVKINDGALEVT